MRDTTSNEGIANIHIWDDLDDPYDHNQLAANWVNIASHNHHGAGDGFQIDEPALTDDAVSHRTVQEGAVGGALGGHNIIDGSICGSDIGDGCITATKLDDSLYHRIVPVGTVVMWYRATPDVAPPAEWVICDGRQVGPNELGVLPSALTPNFTNRFPVGAGSLAGERAEGGSNAVRPVSHKHTVDLRHTHSITASSLSHSHTVNEHTHVVPRKVSSSNVVADHQHRFGDDPNNLHALHSRPYEIYQGLYKERRQAVYVYNFNENDTDAPVEVSKEGGHSHSVTVEAQSTEGASNRGTDAWAHGAISTSGASKDSVDTSTDAPTVDIIPAHIGMVFIMKVRKPS